MRRFCVFMAIGTSKGPVLGYAKQYTNGQWVFSPAVQTGRRATGKRFRSFEACLPKWTGGLDRTMSEEDPIESLTD